MTVIQDAVYRYRNWTTLCFWFSGFLSHSLKHARFLFLPQTRCDEDLLKSKIKALEAQLQVCIKVRNETLHLNNSSRISANVEISYNCGMAFSEDTSGWSEKSGAKDGETEGGVWAEISESYSEGGEREGGGSEQNGAPPGKTLIHFYIDTNMQNKIRKPCSTNEIHGNTYNHSCLHFSFSSIPLGDAADNTDRVGALA